MAGTIPIKTPQRQAGLATRQRRVSRRHRTALFLLGGKRSASEVRSLALKADVPERCFDELLAMGVLPEPTCSPRLDASPAPADVLHVDLPLSGFHADAATDSLLPRAVRAEAPLGGSLTLLRLRRARHLPGTRIDAPLAPA